MIQMNNYHINIFYSHDDECYVADIPDLKYCSAFGDTPEEALAEFMASKKLWLESAIADGQVIPEAKYCPIIYKVS
jgi:predicted RNase H-like HicB family nuclease